MKIKKESKLILPSKKSSRVGWDKQFEKVSKKKSKNKVLEDFEALKDKCEEDEWIWKF